MNKKGKYSSTIVISSLLVLLLVLGGLFLHYIPASANPDVLYVAPSASGSGDCSSWANACNLQTALAGASNGDEIWVKAGVHYPGSNRTDTFTLQSGVALYGGFAGSENSLEQRDWTVNVTVLSGDIDQNDVTDPNGVVIDPTNIQGENAYHVVTGSGVAETAILDGFFITAGQANVALFPDNTGAGLLNWEGSSPTLTHLTFSGNWAGTGGGMLNWEGSSPALTDVTFISNVGGGLWNRHSSPALTDVTFSGNTGGGMRNDYSSPTLTNVTFSGNSGTIRGGGMYNYDSRPVLENVTFSDNAATQHGGGMSNFFNSSPTLTDVTFSGNSAVDDGGGIYSDESSHPTLAQVAFSGNSARRGGGIYNAYSHPTLTDVTFSGNSALDYGGAIYNWYANGSTLTDVTFSANSANYGGGIYNYASSPTLTDVTFTSNTAVHAGGGMSNWYGSHPTLTAVTFSGNTNGMFNSYSSHPTLTDVTFSDNSAENGGGMLNRDSSPTLTRVTFSGNAATQNGGGMYNYNTSSPTLTNVTFSGNSANWDGGGMYNSSSHPTLTDVTFSDNSAENGGGMHISSSSSPALTNVTFSGNSAATNGGGMLNELDNNPTLTNVTFSDNTASNRGGGMMNYGNPMLTKVAFSANYSSQYGGGLMNYGNPTLTNVTFSDNVAAHSGGGMATNNGDPSLTNVTFNGNSADNYGGGMYNYSSSNPILTNVILWGNSAPNGAGVYNDISTPQISYSDIQGCGGSSSWNSICGTNGGGNIETDPLFVDALNGKLRLQLTSPAIDAGNNAALPPDILTDLGGNPRFVDIPTVPDTGSGAAPIVDMGAFEAQYVDVTLSKAVLPTTAAPGQAISFTLTLANTGSIPATGIEVTDTIPAWLKGVSFTSTLTVTDTDNIQPYVWLVQDLAPGQVGLITVNGMLDVPLAAGPYTNTALIYATDDLLAENNTAVITFTVPNVAPVFTSTPLIVAAENEPYTYTTTAQDDNGDALTISASTLPAWLTIVDHGNGTATLAGTPTTADVGENAVLLGVADGGGLTNTQSFTITVANVNDPPEFTSTPVTTATEDALYTYAVTAADPDLIHGDTLTISATTLPTWLTLTDHGNGTATLSGTPVNTNVGDHAVVLRVTDSGGLADMQSFTITVANVNDPPFFTSTPVTTATQDVLYTYAIAAADPDMIHGDTLTLTAQTLPGWLTIEDHGDGTAMLSGTPTTADMGEHTVVLRVADIGGLFNTQTFTIKVWHRIYLPLVLRNTP